MLLLEGGGVGYGSGPQANGGASWIVPPPQLVADLTGRTGARVVPRPPQTPVIRPVAPPQRPQGRDTAIAVPFDMPVLIGPLPPPVVAPPSPGSSGACPGCRSQAAANVPVGEPTSPTAGDVRAATRALPWWVYALAALVFVVTLTDV